MDLVPGADADGAVSRGVWQHQGFIGFGVGLAWVVVAGGRRAGLARTAVLAGPGDRVAVEHAARRPPQEPRARAAPPPGRPRAAPEPGRPDDHRRPRPRRPRPAQPAP